jgi:hypothetical protein
MYRAGSPYSEPSKTWKAVVFDIFTFAKLARPPAAFKLPSGVLRQPSAIRIDRDLFVTRLKIRRVTASPTL